MKRLSLEGPVDQRAHDITDDAAVSLLLCHFQKCFPLHFIDNIRASKK